MIIVVNLISCLFSASTIYVEPDCVICMSRHSTYVLEPCKHLCMCNKCVKRTKECPMCRTKITDRVKYEEPSKVAEKSIGQNKREIVRNFLQSYFRKFGEIMGEINRTCKARGIRQVAVMKILGREETYLWTRDILNTFDWDVNIALVIAYMNPVMKLLKGQRGQTLPNEHVDICFERFVKHAFTTARETLAGMAALPEKIRLKKAFLLLSAIVEQTGFHDMQMHPNMYERVFFEIDATFTPFGLEINWVKKCETKGD